jgi:hypothetical protein
LTTIFGKIPWCSHCYSTSTLAKFYRLFPKWEKYNNWRETVCWQNRNISAMEQSLENNWFWDFSALQLTATQSSLKQKGVIMKCLCFFYFNRLLHSSFLRLQHLKHWVLHIILGSLVLKMAWCSLPIVHALQDKIPPNVHVLTDYKY